MSKSDAFEDELLDLLFTNENIANLGDATGVQGSGVAGNLYVSLHTADPGETGNQSSNETSYTNYVRVAVGRTTGNWTVAGTAPTTVDNDNAITFAQCGVTGATITHFGIGTSSTGAGLLMYSGALDTNLVVSENVTPEFAAGDCNVSED